MSPASSSPLVLAGHHEQGVRLRAQFHLADLAGRGHREAVDEDHVSRDLVARDLAFQRGVGVSAPTCRPRPGMTKGTGTSASRGSGYATTAASCTSDMTRR